MYFLWLYAEMHRTWWDVCEQLLYPYAHPPAEVISLDDRRSGSGS